MKFLAPNYCCLQNPWLGSCRPQIPVLSVLNWLCWLPPRRKKLLGTPLVGSTKLHETLAYTAGKKQNDMASTFSQQNMSVHVSAARRHWDRLHLNAFVCSAAVGRVRRCKISAKYGCSVTTALDRRYGIPKEQRSKLNWKSPNETKI
jgi:hypothetical protein